jgi:hypothetical protein
LLFSLFSLFSLVVVGCSVASWLVCWFSCRDLCSVVAADCTGGHSRLKGAFGVGLRPMGFAHP